MKRSVSVRKALALLLALVMVFSLAACGGGGESAEKAVTNMLEAIKNGDADTASKYIDYGELSGMGDSDSDEETDPEEKEMMQLIFGGLEYKILSSQENGDEADVTVEITNVDMSVAIQDIFTELIALAFTDTDVTEGELEEKMMTMMKDKFSGSDAEKVTTEVTLHMKKNAEGQWKADAEDTLIDALTGGMLSFADEMEGLF